MDVVLILDREMNAPPSIQEVALEEAPASPEGDSFALHEKTVEVERLRIANALAQSELATLRQQQESPMSDAEYYRRKLLEVQKERDSAVEELKAKEEAAALAFDPSPWVMHPECMCIKEEGLIERVEEALLDAPLERGQIEVNTEDARFRAPSSDQDIFRSAVARAKSLPDCVAFAVNPDWGVQWYNSECFDNNGELRKGEAGWVTWVKGEKKGDGKRTLAKRLSASKVEEVSPEKALAMQTAQQHNRTKTLSQNNPKLWREWCGKEQRGLGSEGHVFGAQHRYDITDQGWKY